MTARLAARSGLWFLAAVLILYGIAYALDPLSAGDAMDHALGLAGRLLPVLGIVVLVLFLSSLLLQRQWIRENLGAHSGPRGWLLAAVGGILAAGPEAIRHRLGHAEDSDRHAFDRVRLNALTQKRVRETHNPNARTATLRRPVFGSDRHPLVRGAKPLFEAGRRS